MIFGGKYSYIDNPKTGSTSIVKTLTAHGYGLHGGPRHVPPHDVPWHESRLWVSNVRHPADRLVSGWAYQSPKENFSEWLRGDPFWIGGVDFKRTSQGYWAQRTVAFVIRFETLQDDWRKFLETVGLPKIELGHEYQSNHAPWQDVVTGADLELIRDRFRYDLSHWGYVV